MEDELHLRRSQYADDANLNARVGLHARFSTNPTAWYRWLFARIQPQRFGRVLDVGCGNGGFWREGAAQRDGAAQLEAGYRPLLCDLSAGMLRAARSALGSTQLRPHFVQASARRLPLAAGSFDAALANHMLYHVPDLAGALGELQRVLRPGGLLFASTNGLAHMRELEALLASVRPDLPPNTHAHAFGLETGAAALRRSFEDVVVERYPNRLEVTDLDAIAAYLGSLHPELMRPEDRVRIRELAGRTISARGSFSVTIDAGLLIGRRHAVTRANIPRP